MKLYLLRHAIAVSRGTPGYFNDDRPLTEEGIEKMSRAAEGIAHIVPSVDLILTSPLKRAAETAQIVAKALDGEAPIKTCRQLQPGHAARELYSFVLKQDEKGNLLLVGHEPDLGRFAAYLLSMEKPSVEFKKGGLCRIDVPDGDEQNPKRRGVLVWHLTPKLLRSIKTKNKE